MSKEKSDFRLPVSKSSRRDFLGQSGLSVGGTILAIKIPLGCSTTAKTLRPSAGQSVKTLYLEVKEDNSFVLTFDKSEMGQGVITGQATLFGEEADIPPHKFHMVPAPIDKRFGTMAGLQMTGGSTSTSDRFLILRQAGAKYRRAVLEAAANNLGVSLADLHTSSGYVVVKKTNKKYPYAKFSKLLLEEYFQKDVDLKQPRDFVYIGKYNNSVDASEKCQGQAEFGIDCYLPNQWVAIVIRPPVFGGKLEWINKEQIKKMPGVKDCFAISSGAAIVCEKYYQTLKVRQALKDTDFRWKIGEDLLLDSDQLFRRFHQKLDKQPVDVGEGKKHVSLTFEIPFLAHAPLEPQNCTAFFNGDTLEVWAPTQMPTLVRNMGAVVCDLPREKVLVHTSKFLGGGFGRNTVPSVRDALEITYRLKKPIQVLLSREDDMNFSALRPMSVTRLDAVVSDKIEDWHYQTVSQSILQNSVGKDFSYVFPEWTQPGIAKTLSGTMAGMMDLLGTAPTTVEGAKQPYDLPYDIDSKEIELPIPVFFWRSVGNSSNGFVMESFIDEVAIAKQKDPLELRLFLLQKNSRALNVVKRVAQMSNFTKRQTSRTRGLGIAYHFSFHTHVAEVADVEVLTGDTLKIHKVWAVIDCGQVVNPHIVEAQVRSAVVFGLSAALRGKIDFRRGSMQQSNYDSYQPLFSGEVHDVEVSVERNDKAPTGIGEPGLPPAAAAVGNAVAAITGKRLTRLPFDLKQTPSRNISR